eukprot:3039924-Prymnesium_polylepis.1
MIRPCGAAATASQQPAAGSTASAGALGGWDGAPWDGSREMPAQRRVEQLERRVAELEETLRAHRQWTSDRLERVVKYIAADRRRGDRHQDALAAIVGRFNAANTAGDDAMGESGVLGGAREAGKANEADEARQRAERSSGVGTAPPSYAPAVSPAERARKPAADGFAEARRLHSVKVDVRGAAGADGDAR